MDNNFFNPKGVERERRKSQIMMAIVATFALLLLVFIILLCISIVTAIGDRTPADEGETNIPSDEQTPDEPDVPVVPEQTQVTVTSADMGKGTLILVNSTHAYSFPEAETHLVNVFQAQTEAQTKDHYFLLANQKLRLEQTTYQAMTKMLTDFSTQTGNTDVQLTDGYRSRDDQNNLGTLTKGGYSDHHTGYTLALNIVRGNQSFELVSDANYQWIFDNCYKYGFVQRYPTAKTEKTGVPGYPECFRYVGYAHAYVMTREGLCLEEYVEYLRNYTYDAPLKIESEAGNYEIYYVLAAGAETQIPVTKDSNYTISGDNDRGYIVTVKLP